MLTAILNRFTKSRDQYSGSRTQSGGNGNRDQQVLSSQEKRGNGAAYSADTSKNKYSRHKQPRAKPSVCTRSCDAHAVDSFF
jgi:hypothetical protein